MSKTTLQPMTPPRQRIRTRATAPCIHAERKRNMSEWRRSSQSRKRLHTLQPINLFPTPEREEKDNFLTSHESNFATAEKLWKPRSFTRGRTNSFGAFMIDGVGTNFLDGTATSESNSGPMMRESLEVGKKRRRDNNVCSFTPNTDLDQKLSADALSNTPKRSHVLIHKLSKRSQKSRLQDVLFDPNNNVAMHV